MTTGVERSARASRVGDRIAGRFELLALAGSGGGGEVYRARDVAHGGATVALKLMHEATGDAARFAREASMLAAVEHPGVVRHLAHGRTETGEPYLVMEWLEGEGLDARLARGTLDSAAAVALARAVAEALAAAHALGIVHRDLKPANLFLTGPDLASVRIVDFGLARTLQSDGLSLTGAVVGTPGYMAPEQVRGEPVDARVDVYGLGAVLFHALTGRAPFQGAHAVAVLARVLVEDLPPLRDLCPDAPAALEALLGRMLAKSAAERPADAAAVLTEIDALPPDEIAGRPLGVDRPAARARMGAAITGGEQRVACVVLCGRPGARRASDETVPARATVDRDGEVRQAIERRGGVLDALPDGTLLVTVREAASPAEQAERAARCALALRALRADAPVVVATGRVLRGGALRTGEALDRAAGALLEAGTMHAVARVDAATADLLDDRFEVRGEGPWRELTGERDTLLPVRTFLGRPARCVGRARELATLADALASAAEEPRAAAVLVTAPPGLGKSRLVHEFVRSTAAERAGTEVLIARGDPARAGSTFAAAAQMIRRAARATDADPPEVCRGRVRAMLAACMAGADAVRAADLLAEIAGAPAPHAEASDALRAARADATLMADAVREAWVDWLRARCDAGAVVLLLLEDLHWADLPSVRLVDAALEALPDRALMVLATARPEVHATFPGLWRARGLQELALGPLPRRAAEQLARDVLGEGSDAAVVRAVVDRAGGEPFHLEELLRATATGRAAVDELPDSVLGMVQARFDVLEGDDRRVLRAASVFGGSFTPEGIAAVTGDPGGARAVESRLARLRDEEIVARLPAAAFAFRHALVRDAAYATLTPRDRQLAHRLAGAWLEAAGERDPAVLAEHYDRGGDAARALGCFLRAARLAMDGSDLDRATALVERARGCEPDAAQRAALRAIESEVAFWRGEHARAAEFAEEAAAGLVPGSPGWFDAASVAIAALGQHGRNDRVLAWLERAAEAPSAPEARAAHAVALCRGLTQLYWAHHAGALERVRARLSALSRAGEDDGGGEADPFEAAWVRRVGAEAAWLHARDVDACLAGFDASCAAYEQARALRALCLTRLNSASLHGWSGEIERGRELVARSLAEAERLRAGFLRNYGHTVRALIETYAGAPGAEASFRAALPGVAASPRLAFVCRVYLGMMALERGDAVTALAEASLAGALAVAPELQPAALAVRSLALGAQGELDAALADAVEAVRTANERSDLELTEGLACLALVEAHRARGDEVTARAALASGYGRLAEIAARVASPERRARFWARRFPNDRLHALAVAWGLENGQLHPAG